MRARMILLCVVVAIVGSYGAVMGSADEPIFVRWLVADDPGDETLRNYWDRAERDELGAPALVDLGTMLYHRGFTKDAVRVYRSALDLDPDLYEAWFRIGLAEHSRGELDNARQAYKRCLKKRPGHGWCNFYLGLLEEELGHSSNALDHYRRAFKHAPELANPKVNPEILSSDLALGAHLEAYDQRRFDAALPMRYLEPNKVKKMWRQYEPTPAASPEAAAEEASEGAATDARSPQSAPSPAAQSKTQPPPRKIPARRAPTPRSPTAQGSDQPGGPAESPYGMRSIGNTSDEAHLMPWWPNLSQVASALV
jgi:tetratricopeptide (TPR) repeat protein